MKQKKGYRLYRVIRWLVWLFSPKFRLVGEENLPEGACVIVGNHSHMYGPISAEIYTPGKHYTWCTGEMTDRKTVAEYAYRDFWSIKPKSVRWFYRLLSHVIGPLAELIFTNADTIPVYHDARLFRTFRESEEKLKEGCRVVIFPECYEEHNNIVHAFQEHFVDLARFHYRETGEKLQFVPVYVCPKLKTLYYESPVVFDPDADIETERKRVCRALMDAVTARAVSLPEHTVIPYPNVSKREYRKNIPLEDLTHEETAG